MHSETVMKQSGLPRHTGVSQDAAGAGDSPTRGNQEGTDYS